MIGVGGIVGAFLLLALFYALGICGVLLCIYGFIIYLRTSNKFAATLVVIGALLMSPVLTLMHKSYDIKNTLYTIQTTIPFNVDDFRIHPDVYRDELGGKPRQMLWGEIDLDVTLPAGGTIRGNTNRISLRSTTDGKFYYLKVFFQPDMGFYRGTSIQDVFAYWKNQGKVIWDYPGRLRVDCGEYIIDLGQIDGWLTLSAVTNQESEQGAAETP